MSEMTVETNTGQKVVPVRLHRRAGDTQSSFELERKGTESPAINAQRN